MQFLVFALLLASVACVVGHDDWIYIVKKQEEVVVFVSNQSSASGIASTFGGEAVKIQYYEPEVYLYYLLENQNNSFITQEWIDHIMPHVNKLYYRSALSVLVAVRVGDEAKFLGNLPFDVVITSVASNGPYVGARSDMTFLEKLASEVMEPNDAILDLVNKVNQFDLRNFVEYLSGELEGSPITTRNSISTGAVEASVWLQKQFTSFGFQTTTQCFMTGYSCNVAAVLTGTTLPSEVVIVGAHYDSRSTNINSATQRAPGANDDGSGTGTLLQIAKIIFESNAKFARTIHLVAFSGEEQGLLGSAAYATEMVNKKVNVVAMLQNDMIAYRAPNAKLLCGFPTRYTTPALTSIAIAATNTYSPTITTGRNDRCCSDHASFYERGFAATDFSDTLGPIVDPAYHQSTDLVNRVGFDFDQYTGIVKGIFATAAVVAEVV